MEAALPAAVVLQHSFGLSIQQLEGRLGRDWMDPFVSAHSKDKFKTKYQFYHNDVRALARALGLPGAHHHRPSRNTAHDASGPYSPDSPACLQGMWQHCGLLQPVW